MQLARPGVGYGVMESRVESGRVDLHPIKRARTTFTYLAVADQRHRPAEGRVPPCRQRGPRPGVLHRREPGGVQRLRQGPAAVGRQPACTRASSMCCRLFVGEMDEETADQYYLRGRSLGTTLQVPEAMWPADRAAFDRVLAGIAGRGAHRRRSSRIPVPDRRGSAARRGAARAAAQRVGEPGVADHDGLSAAALSRRDAAALGSGSGSGGSTA